MLEIVEKECGTETLYALEICRTSPVLTLRVDIHHNILEHDDSISCIVATLLDLAILMPFSLVDEDIDSTAGMRKLRIRVSGCSGKLRVRGDNVVFLL